MTYRLLQYNSPVKAVSHSIVSGNQEKRSGSARLGKPTVPHSLSVIPGFLKERELSGLVFVGNMQAAFHMYMWVLSELFPVPLTLGSPQ